MSPIPFFLLRDIYNNIARQEWDDPNIGLPPPFNMDNQGLILSALAHPFATAGGHSVYPTIPAKAAALFRGLVKNHGLGDGNKRLAVTIMTAFLVSNGWLPTYNNLQLYRYALRVARKPGNYDVALIERWIRRNAELLPDADLKTLRKQNQDIHNQIAAGPFGDIVTLALHPILLPVNWRDDMEVPNKDDAPKS